MMTIGGTAHILMLITTVLVIISLMFIISKLSYRWQCFLIYSAVAVGMIGIAFLHLTHYGTSFDPKNFFDQMFQVCNFNFILLPLSLIKKNELGRQYLFFFSMPAAASTFVAYPSDVAGSMWYSVVTLNFWIDHLIVVLVPLLMIAAKWFKPQTKYVKWVLLCIFVYFLAAFVANYCFNRFNLTGPHNHSYTMNDGDILILKPLFNLIPLPFVYLLPLLPVLYLIFYLESLCFQKYNLKNKK